MSSETTEPTYYDRDERRECSDELNPCPACKGKCVIISDCNVLTGERTYSVACDYDPDNPQDREVCETSIHTRPKLSLKEAVEQWNRFFPNLDAMTSEDALTRLRKLDPLGFKSHSLFSFNVTLRQWSHANANISDVLHEVAVVNTVTNEVIIFSGKTLEAAYEKARIHVIKSLRK